MNYIVRSICFCLFLFLQIIGSAAIHVGLGKTEITPPIGTPSAGYTERKGAGMIGVHDPLFANALFIDNGEKQLFFCSVDHLGFPYDITKEICLRVHKHRELSESEIYIFSSHTHAGGGAFLNVPGLGEALAGTYDPKIVEYYIETTTQALLLAYKHRVPAKIGIGYGKAPTLHFYRGLWPQDVLPPSDISVIKITTLEDDPLAVLFNYAVHPTVLTGQNRLFSADFVGYARTFLESFLGPKVQALYANGAQGDLLPVIFDKEDRFASCEILGKAVAETVKTIWEETQTQNSLHICSEKYSYAFTPKPTPFGLTFPIDLYHTEMNILVLNHSHAFLTIPGELSCLYDQAFQQIAVALGFSHVSIFGLCNDAHGYIIRPDSWRHKTYESGLSFGGEEYGDITLDRAKMLLQAHAPIRK
ncbi:MAG: neutral/alkaline non-lysosomal ceramidase N-terminal domain-containing protein [Rhabdochlamydiaceae bacterium]|nr:neutral/alkaline non-lysosomal ceramidase N-terminal domain-containing protein [Rhabdochlamydiaceae bacterium]